MERPDYRGVAVVNFPEPYDFGLSTERFRAFGPDNANLWYEGGLHRVVRSREVRIEPAPGGVLAEPLDATGEGEVRKLLGAPFDLGSFAEFASSDEVLDGVVRALAGFRPPLAPDPFEALVGSVTAQQVSLFSAFAVRNRLIERFGRRALHAWAFPSAERIASASEAELVAVGFSRRKAEYVLGLARAELDYGALESLPDEEVKARLVALRGFGEWTADWFLARYLARSRAWPAGDLGLRKAVSAFYADGRELTTEEVRSMGDRFDPFQNLSAHYLLTGHRVLA